MIDYFFTSDVLSPFIHNTNLKKKKVKIKSLPHCSLMQTYWSLKGKRKFNNSLLTDIDYDVGNLIN